MPGISYGETEESKKRTILNTRRLGRLILGRMPLSTGSIAHTGVAGTAGAGLSERWKVNMSKTPAVFSATHALACRPGVGPQATIIPAGPGYSLLTIDEDNPEGPVWSDDVPALIAYAEHDAMGIVEVDVPLQPLSVMGTRGGASNISHYLNEGLKTPSGRVYCGCGDACFNSVTEWEYALREALRARAAQ